MKITIVGSGYVGLVAGACFAELGNDVICLDVDVEKVEALKTGVVPIYEPGLDELIVRSHREGRLQFTVDKRKAIQFAEIIFIAVGTPMGENYEADLRDVRAVAADIGTHMQEYKVVVNKSTVPVGTAAMVKAIIKQSQPTDIEVDVVSNPEFLREGAAIKDFMLPDRVVVGSDSERAEDIMRRLYQPLVRIDHPMVVTDIKSAELIKYAANAMLATRISFMNELSHLAEAVGADIKKVALGMGLDKRIGSRFLQAGVGYGGSCFPKDVQALIHTMKESGCHSRILNAVEEVNNDQKLSLIPKVERLVGDLAGKKIAVWGLAFKPKTDDIRNSPALQMIAEMQRRGAVIAAFDPVAESNCRREGVAVEYVQKPLDALVDADCLVLITEWDVFRGLDRAEMKRLMKSPNIADGRNVYDQGEMRSLGFNYLSVGR
ncbi:MAG: UDP-glucose/GDP-mannose dehydrogenase family protein [Kiritimatiellia bacterium]